MLRKDSSSEWVMRDVRATYDNHAHLNTRKPHNVGSQLCLKDLNNLATVFNLQYCGPRMNALGDNESVFLETSALLPYFPSSTTLCQRVTYWRMFDASRNRNDVIMASLDNLLLSLFDFCKLRDDEHGWKQIFSSMELALQLRDKDSTVDTRPYLHFEDTLAEELSAYWTEPSEAIWNSRLPHSGRPVLIADYHSVGKRLGYKFLGVRKTDTTELVTSMRPPTIFYEATVWQAHGEDADPLEASFYKMHLKLQRSQPTFGSIRFHVR